MSQFDPSETYVRSDAVLEDIDVRQRLITVLAVPWDQEAEVPWRNEIWREVFRRGAFDGLEDHVGRVRVNREHVKGKTVGKVVFADPQAADGLILRSKIASTPRGDETLALADEDMISASVGYRIKDSADLRLERRTRMREVLRAFLDHLGMVESPAFAGAQVLAVREDQPSSTVEPPPEALVIDEAYAHPAYVAALERLSNH